MPELPEVETIVRKLRPELVGKSIVKADLFWPRTLATPAPKEFLTRIIQEEIRAVERRAKYFVIQLSRYYLIIHLRMSGDLYIKEENATPEKHDRLILSLTPDPSLPGIGEVKAKKKLVFNDSRKFGRVWLVGDQNEVVGGLGPEPLGENFTAQSLYESLQSRRRQLKPLLLDQSFIAGLGNIYTDEALHKARLHPAIRSDSVQREQAGVLRDAIREVLEEGIRRNGASIDWVYRGGDFQNYFRVYGRKGQPCPVCGTLIVRLVIGQRSTHVCPDCQRIGS